MAHVVGRLGAKSQSSFSLMLGLRRLVLLLNLNCPPDYR